MTAAPLTVESLAAMDDAAIYALPIGPFPGGDPYTLLRYVVALRRDLRALLEDRDALEDRRRLDLAALAQHRRHAERVTQAAIEWLESARDRGDESRYTVIQTLPDVVAPAPVAAAPAPIAKPAAKWQIALGLDHGRMYSLDEIEAIYAERRERVIPTHRESLDQAMEAAREWFARPA